MGAHTPGPWKAEGDSVSAHHVAGDPRVEYWICDGVNGDRRACATDGRPSDNARLIAAAPELLKALQWYVDNDDTNIGQPGNESYEAGLNRARAAIAKATGGES